MTFNKTQPSRSRSKALTSVTLGCFLMGSGWLCAQEKVTFQDHLLPLIENNCAKCHNPDKKKGDLDLTSYNGIMKGGGSGAVVVSGNPDSSKLWRAIMQVEDPCQTRNWTSLENGFSEDCSRPQAAKQSLPNHLWT